MPVRRNLTSRALLVLLATTGLAYSQEDPGLTPSAPAQPQPTAPAQPQPPATATTAPAPQPTAPERSGSSAGASAGSYAVKLRDLERRVNELKEQIFRSKARLNLLKETVLHGIIAGSRAVIIHRNEMGGVYTPIAYTYSLDGNVIFSKADESGHLSDQKEIEIFNNALAPGNHTLSVELVYRGNGAIFKYVEGYKFTAHSSHTFTAGEGKQLQLKVVGYEKGNPITTDFKDRPAVDFRENVISDKDAVAKQASAKK
jgi:hypothetical protein